MKVLDRPFPGALILEPTVYKDERGFFLESYNQTHFAGLGIAEKFVQDNHSFSKRGVIRGLHYQTLQPQGKLIRVIAGEILDVFVDLRRSSPTFGRSHAIRLSGENRLLAWIPVGFAHGFQVLSENAHVLYKTTDFYAPQFERTLLWNDPDLRITWKEIEPLLSEKDKMGTLLKEAETFS